MALQVWLPLIKDLTNYGLANVTVTSNAVTQSTTEGKLGTSYSFNGSTTWIKTTMPSSIKSLKNTSVCMWIKSTASVGAGGGIMHDTTNAYACMCLYTSGWQMATGSSWKYISTGTFANTSVWHHIACTMDDTTIRTYFDGALITETTIAAQGVLTDMTSNNFIGLGCDFPGGNEYFTGFINDFRVYDHCLSKREVKEISKGLVCHYLLNNNGIGNPNLVPNQGKYYSESTAYVRTSASKDGNAWLTGSHFIVEPSTTYTFSVCSDGNLSSSHATGGNDPSLKLFTMWLYLCNSDTTKNPDAGGYDNPVCFTSANYNHQQNGNRHIWQYTTKSTETHMSVRVNNYSNGTDNLTIKYWQIKIEKGSKATPWIPHTSDAQYAVFTQGNKIEYDCSGYQNNGTKTNITTTPDTPRNTLSSVFNGTNSYIACGRGGMVRDEITLSLWAYSDDWSRHISNECMLSCTEGGGWSVAKNTNGNLTVYMGTGTSSNSYIVVGYTLTNMKTGWNYIVSTYDGLSSKLYVNGVMVTSKTQYSTKTPIYYHGSNGIFIGAEAGSGPITPISSDKFSGYLSDLRIYATALSDTDILELYNVPINFNKHSVMIQGEFIEK